MPRAKKPAEKSAFPRTSLVETVARVDSTPGLTSREIFAGLSLLGTRCSGITVEPAFAAKAAVADADCLIAELAREVHS